MTITTAHAVGAAETSGLVDLGGMAAGEVLAFVESRHAARVAAERDVLVAAYRWSRLHPGDGYAAAALGARIQTSAYGAKRLIADAVELVERLPRLWAGVEAGTVRARHARHVAECTRDLSAGEAAWVDGEVVGVADGRLAWARFEALVEGKVAAAAPESARLREEQAARERGVRMSRVNRFGMATLTVRADAATVVAIDAGIAAVARSLEVTMADAGVAERRVSAVAVLTNPAAHVDPAVGAVRVTAKVYLHLAPDSPIARMEGHGPVTTAWVRHLLDRLTGHLTGRAAGRVRVTPVVDLAGQVPVDAYEIPSRLREAVHLVHPGDVFPYAAGLTRRVDLDHNHPYAEGGPTCLGNLAPLNRTHHRIKTHGGWEARQPFPGIVVWRDPYGAFYLVDATGTRRIG